MKRYEFEDPVFKTKLDLFICKDQTKLADFLQNINFDWRFDEICEEISNSWNKSYLPWKFYSQGWYSIIRLRDRSIYTFIHELSHFIWDNLYCRRWVELSELNDEPFAYMFEYYFKLIDDKVKFIRK